MKMTKISYWVTDLVAAGNLILVDCNRAINISN